MNDPKNQPVDIEEQRAWLIDHKTASGMSWTDLGKRIGRSPGTLSQFGGKNGYAGDELSVAEQVFQYRQLLLSQKTLKGLTPIVPAYFASPTALDIEQALIYAQSMKRTAVIATGAGMGKTTAIRHYQAAVSNVFIATMAPSSAGVNNMQIIVLRALGELEARGTPQRLSEQIMNRLRNTGGLLVIDEAQHLSEKALEEIRSWYDALDIGVALVGNESVIGRLEGGSRKANFAQLFSRIGRRIVRPLPLQGDADALCDAWDIGDAKVIEVIRKIAQKPGGLRGATMAMELAWMIAASEGVPVNSGHVRDCWAQLSSRPLAS